MIDEALVALLKADAGVSAIAAGRIFQIEAPDDRKLYPCVSYAFVGGGTSNTLNDGDVYRQRIEINAHDFDASVAAQLRTAIIRCVSSWQGVLSDGTQFAANLLNPGTDFVTEQRVFRRMAEFYVLYTQPN